jgi:hypothetical protein
LQLQALIAGKVYVSVVMLAQGSVAPLRIRAHCTRCSTETRGKSGKRANVKCKYSISAGVVPRRDEFRQIPCEINSLKKVGV